jgi:DNA-binding CsgD family transcriptional regulator
VAPWTRTRYLGVVALLLERDGELNRLGLRLDAARAGEGSHVVVEGAPGLGKSSLLRAAAREAERRDFEVLRARGAELEREWPFGIVRQLLEPALRRRSADKQAHLLDGAAGLAAPLLLPECARVIADVDTSFGTLHGLYWLCANLATDRPLLLAVDDAHWADDASLRFLGVLARRLDALPLLLVLAQRPGPPGALAELAADPQTERLGVRPLSSAGARALLAQWSPDGEVASEFALACDDATGGNPFLLSRLAVGLSEQEVAFTAANAGRVMTAGADAVRDAVGATLARLDAAAVALAEAVAVLGDDAEPAVAAELAGIDHVDAAADELARSGVLEDARPLRFVHAIVRDAVTARLSAGVRDRLHARAAEILAARRAGRDAVAVHLLATEPRGRGWVVDQLTGAARGALAQGAPETAAARLERALAEPPAPELQAEVLLELARAESRLGRPAAIEHFQEAHELASDSVLRARAALEFSWASGPTLELSTGLARLERAIADVDGNSELALELEAARLFALQASATIEGEAWWAEMLKRWAQLEGRTPGERLLLAQLAIAQMQAGGPADVCAGFAERAVADTGFEALAGGAISLMFAIIVLFKADHLDVAERVLERELRIARRRGSLSTYAVVCTFRGVVEHRRGALAEAEADLRAGLDVLLPDTWQRVDTTSALIDVLTDTGRLDEAQSMLSGGHWDGELPDNRATTVLLASRSRLRHAQGEHRRALADALEARRRMARGAGGVDINWDGWSRIALLHHTLGESAQARQEADTFLDLARRWDTPAAIGQALWTVGLIEGRSRGLALLRDAVEHLERSPARLLLAHALVELGAAQRRAGDRSLAREPLRRGLDLASASGAQPLAERARQELAATGVRVRRDAQTGIDALTPSERRVAEHAASGATNPQIAQALFVTVKTVEMHLGNVYRKLDINSRHRLAAHLGPAATDSPQKTSPEARA